MAEDISIFPMNPIHNSHHSINGTHFPVYRFLFNGYWFPQDCSALP